MREKLVKLIKKEDKKNPYTDAKLAEILGTRREQITLLRKELNIPDSRERKKEVLIKAIQNILKENKNISERQLTKMIKEQGFKVSRHCIRDYRKEIENKQNQHNLNGNKNNKTQKLAEINKKKYSSFDNLIGADGSLKPFIQQAKAAMLYPPNGLHTLIVGATGVGKSELAAAMYEFAKEANVVNKNAPFIVFNCADYADNPQLLMAQLFGYVKGAFTGAESDKEGLVEKANGSILFLDEVHRLPPEGQELLFYLIDKGKFRRLGETDIERKVQVTIIAATTENPDSILLSTFRRRIPMVIELPSLNARPLKERLEIIKEFIRKEACRTQNIIKVNNEALRALLLYDCPGNVGQLRSDIQVSCARSFLNHVINQTDIMEITIDELPPNAKKGLLKIQNNRYETEQLTGNTDVIIYPDDKPNKIYIKEDIYVLPNEIYKYVEQRYNDLQSQGMSHELINYIIGSEMEKRLEKLIKKVKDNVRPLEKKDLVNIVGIEVINVVEKIIRIANWKLGITAENLYYVLAVHISATIERLKQGKIIKNPQLNKIKIQYKKEFKIAKEMVDIIQQELNIKLSEDEAGYITMYLRMMTKEKETVAEGRVGVVVISHGNVASGMAEVANRLLGVMHARAIEMSLDESPEVALERATELVKSIDEGKGVLLLVDMGSLVTFSELITKKTGIKTRCLTRTDTVMVIEAVRRAILPGANLDEIADTLEEKPKYISRLVEDGDKRKEKVTKKPKVIITICITGQGSAQKIKELLENVTCSIDEDVSIIPIGALESNIEEVILDIRDNNELLAIVGTVNPNINDVPFIALEDIVKGKGVKTVNNILNNIKSNNIKKTEKGKELKLSDLVHPSITLLNMKANNKRDAITQLSELLYKNGFVKDGFTEAVLERERLGFTYLGNGIAIPHADPSYIIKTGIAIGKLREELCWDGNKVKFIMLLALKPDCINIVHQIYDFFSDSNNYENLMNKDDFREIKELLSTT